MRRSRAAYRGVKFALIRLGTVSDIFVKAERRGVIIGSAPAHIYKVCLRVVVTDLTCEVSQSTANSQRYPPPPEKRNQLMCFNVT